MSSGMTKAGTGAKLEESNIALLGSQLEKDVKKVAAMSEEAWKGAGQAVGVRVWRIEKFEVKDWPKQQYGSFFEGDAYIILNSFKQPGSKKLSHNIHFWLGSKSSQDEQGVAAYKSVELDDFLGQVPVQYREVEGHESSKFNDLFPSIKILSGGVDSGFEHVKHTEYKARLLHVKGTAIGCVVKQVPLAVDSLNTGDCFVLDAGVSLYQWNGPASNPAEKTKARRVCEGLKEERALEDGEKWKCEVLEGLEDDSKEFWNHFGLQGPPKKLTAVETPDDGPTAVHKLFKISDASGEMKFTPVKQGKITVKDLNVDDVFLLDIGVQLYVWIGRQASREERAKGMVFAMSYLNRNKMPTATPIIRILEGGETQGFKDAVLGADFEGEEEEKPYWESSETQAVSGSGEEEKKGGVDQAALQAAKNYLTNKPLEYGQLAGVLQFTIHEAKELRKVQMLGKQDPYCIVKVGKQKARGPVHENGDTEAKWNDFSCKIELTGKETHPLFQVKNDNVLIDSAIGTCGEVPMALAVRGMEKQWYPLLAKNNKAAGQICVSSKYLPPVSMRVNACKELPSKQMIGKMDPFVTLKYQKLNYKTPTHTDGSKNPSWKEKNVFDLNLSLLDGGDLTAGENELVFEVWNANLIMNDLLGVLRMSPAEVLKCTRKSDVWLPLKTGRSVSAKEKGSICITVL